jgi:hypothetical protein
MRNAYKIFVEELQRKRPRSIGEDNIKMGIIKETECEGVDWIQVAGFCEHYNEPPRSIKNG